MTGGEGGGDAGADGPDPELLAEAVDRMAHQIKNPLQAVAVNLEVIRMRVDGEAPELWSELERYGDAVDQNVSVLDRRLRLLLALGRRSGDDPPESVDAAALVRDFAAALRLDEERPRVRVEAPGTQLAARARPGFVLELALDLWRTVRRRAPEAAELPVTVGAGGDTVALEVTLPAGAGGEGAADARERWRRLARGAGGRLEAADGEDGAGLRLVLPAD